jgi:uncharacterized membrane protein YcaP (DUF421 family)
MWQSLMVTGVPLLEKAVRTIAVYLVMVLLLRLAGKRELAQLTGFDLVVMLLLSNVVQNAIIGPDNSLWGGLFGAAVLLGVNALVVRLAVVVPRLGWWFRGPVSVLAKDGAYDTRTLRRLGLRPGDVDQAILSQSGDSVADTRQVSLEPGGAILVRLKESERTATSADIVALKAQLDRIERMLQNG